MLSQVLGMAAHSSYRIDYYRVMPVHDWTRVPPAVFQDQHLSWLVELSRALGHALPEEYYAMIEHRPSADAPAEALSHEATCDSAPSMPLPPRVSRVVVRYAAGDLPIAVLEIVSPVDKENRQAVERFADESIVALKGGYHLVIIDLLPPGPADPQGIHGEIWHRLGGVYAPPAATLLTLAAYAAPQAASGPVTCHVEPTAVGRRLPDMPLFLDPGYCVNVPLESTYMAAFEGVPKRWKRVIEGQA
jgi:hypothetical protein